MKRVTKAYSILFFIVIILIVLYGVLGECILPSEKQNRDGFCHFDNQEWYQVMPDGSKEEIEVPCTLDIEMGEDCVIEKTIPEGIKDGEYYIFRSSKQDMKVFIDGQLRTIYTTVNTRWFGKASPTYYVFVKINSEDVGKTINVHLKTSTRYSGVISDIYHANYNGFLEYGIRTQGMVFFVAVIMTVIGVLTLMIGIILNLIYKKEQKLTSISLGVLSVSIWMLGNSLLRQYIFSNISIVSDLTFLMVAVMPIPFASYINQIQEKRYNIAYFSIELLALLDIIISSILHILNVMDFSETFYAMAIMLFALLLTIVITLILDIVHKYIKKYIVTAGAIFVAGIVMVLQIAIYLRTDKNFDISIAALGLLIILIIALVDTVKDVYKLNQDRQQAILTSAAKSQFLANMSHEIRTPINAVLGMDTMILRECKDDKIRGYANNIKNAGNSLLSIINDILDFSKIESGKMTIINVEYDFANLINDVVNMIHPKLTDKNLELKLDINPGIPRKCIGDELRIKQILINLLTNAAKYTHQGAITLSINRLSDGENGEARLNFSVKDTGIGIKAEDISKLTEEFVRIEESRNRNIEGTGLGINIVVSLLSLMGSRLMVDSVYGEGSDFHFELKQGIANKLPLGNFVEKVQENVEAEEYVASVTIPDARLLVVDDNEINRMVFKKLLSELKCRIDEAGSGKECLELVKLNKYDIIFMDHMMPEMDGIETFEHMKGFGTYINAETPVIILTANAVNGVREEYMKAGFDEYMSKPIDPDILEDMIKKYVSEDKKVEVQKKNLEHVEKVTSEALDLPFIDGVDWNYALLKLKGMNLLKNSVNSFLSVANMDISKLEELYKDLSVSSEGLNEFRVKVHSMKTNAATIGAIHVAGLAKYIEYAARDNDIYTIHKLIPVFMREWKNLRDSLLENFHQEEVVEENPIEDSELSKYLDFLTMALNSLNVKRIDTVMAAIKSHTYKGEQKELLDKLDACVIGMDTATGVEIINKWKGMLNK